MAGIPEFPPKIFHRIRPPVNPRSLDEMISKGTTDVVTAELADDFKVGHGLLVASWDGSEYATVFSIGIVIGVGADGRPKVEWTSGPFQLARSSRSGDQFWSQPKPTFKFAKTVADDLKLKGFFSKHCKDPFAASRPKTA